MAIRTTNIDMDIREGGTQPHVGKLRSVAPGATWWLSIGAFFVALVLMWHRLAEAVAIAAIVLAGGAAWLSARRLAHARALNDAADRSVRIERATATASRALLRRDVADPVGTALQALIGGVDADAVFLETNSHEPPDEHGNLASVRDILYADRPGKQGRWELGGWRVSGQAQELLAAGLGHTTAIARLDAMTLAYYRAMEIRSEVLLPITIDGRWIGSLGFISDDRNRIWTSPERRLLEIGAEMIGSYWERRDARARLEESLAARDEFIASVGHAIRTPLTAVVGFASELDAHIDRFPRQERSNLISLLAEQSNEIADIVDDLLTAAGTEAETVVEPEVLSVRRLVGEVLASHARRVDFVMQDDLHIWADATRVRQILRNLLANAGRNGGDVVAIHARRTGTGAVNLEVRDNGEGIPGHLRDHVFEPYGRAHSGSTQPETIGLGLAVARRLATMMEGELALSGDDGWTVFTLSLPAAAPAPQSVAS